MAEHMRSELVLSALESALGQRIPSASGLLFHSDRGSQYASDAYQSALQPTKDTFYFGLCFPSSI